MNIRTVLILALLLALSIPALTQAQKPSDLKFQPLDYQPPDPSAFRSELPSGLRTYIQEDHSLPQFTISAMINFGELYVPENQRGLGALMGQTLVQGGTATKEGDVIEERINFLGGSLNFMVGERTSTLTLWVLRKDMDEGLALFFDVLRNPAFREVPLNLARVRLIQQLRQANDQASGVLAREFEKILYGKHPITFRAVRQTYESITAADLKAIHQQYFVPKNIILAASGDFAATGLKEKIGQLTAGWESRDVAFPALSREFAPPEPGVYFIQKEINQGYISLGHLGLEESNPDYYAVQVMNFILGGGSFTSRITTKVRSNEGLSYNQGSRFTFRWGFPGTFAGYVQTKSSTVGYAISLILNEFNRIRQQPVTDAELDMAINYYLESFPGVFESPQATMSTFAEMEMTGRPMDYYQKYRSRIKAVTKARVQEVAGKYIQPDKMAIMIVGDWEPCNAGGEKWPGPLDKLGKVHQITLPDPLTGQ